MTSIEDFTVTVMTTITRKSNFNTAFFLFKYNKMKNKKYHTVGTIYKKISHCRNNIKKISHCRNNIKKNITLSEQFHIKYRNR